MESTREESTLSQLTSAVCPSKDFEWLTNCVSSYETALAAEVLKMALLKLWHCF